MPHTGTFCGSAAHVFDRRGFLGTLAAGAAFAADMTALNALTAPALAGELKRQQKHVILLWLAGGASQLETWDPKPGTPTGGPFRPMETSAPGVRISEHMPITARQMNKLAVIRSLTTTEGDHMRGRQLMHTAYTPNPAVAYPSLGSVAATGRPWSC